MKEKAELSLLLDYYGAFLTDKQRELLRMSADEDMSLSEISEVVGVSRQGVRDALVNAANKLADFERKLGLLERDAKLRLLLDRLDGAITEKDAEAASEAAKEIRTVLK